MLDLNRFARIEPLHKGLSGDEKFYVETHDGARLLLRVAQGAQAARKRAEYTQLEQAATLGIPMSRPLVFGEYGDGRVYLLLTWCEGEDVEALLPRLPPGERYALGVKAGKLLRRLHTLPAADNATPWGPWFTQKAQARIEASHAFSLPGLEHVRAFLCDSLSRLHPRPQTFHHGDYNPGNLILSSTGELGIIDFNAHNRGYGDPWWELCTLIWGQEIDAPFYCGQLHGYFDGDPPCALFPVLACYFAYGALAAVCDTAAGEEGEPEDGPRHLSHVLRWFDGMANPVPSWYFPPEGAPGREA